jgi:hypothetical protein
MRSYLLWYCHFKVSGTSPLYAHSGPSWSGSKRLHCNLLRLWSFKIPGVSFLWHCPFKISSTFPSPRVRTGPSWRGANYYTVIACDTAPLRCFSFLWHCPFKVPGTFPSCAQSGPSWNGSERLHCNLLWLWSFKIPGVCPSCGAVPLKYLVLFPHVRSLVPHGEGARDSTVIYCVSGPFRYLVFVLLVALFL